MPIVGVGGFNFLNYVYGVFQLQNLKMSIFQKEKLEEFFFKVNVPVEAL